MLPEATKEVPHEHQGPEPEILKKAEACNTAEELFALAKAEGIELSDEDIAEIAGGGYLHSLNSPKRERRAWGSDEGSSGE